MSREILGNRILYYPRIEFFDETWLKCAILIWDKIYRIVPQSYTPSDSYEVKEAVDAGLVKNIQLTPADLEQAATGFIEFVKDLPFPLAGFKSSSYEVRLHREKIDGRLIDYFREHSSKIMNNGFLKIDHEIANGYMFYLASTVSNRRNIQKATDDPDMYAAMTYFDYQGKFDEILDNGNSREGILNIIVENIIPSDIEELSIKTVMDISKNNEVGKKEFREKLSKVAYEISKIEEPTMMKEIINDFKSDILKINKSKRNDLLQAVKSIKSSFLFIGLPALLTAVTGSLLFPAEGALIGNEIAKGIAVSSIASLSESANGIRNKWKEKNNNYLLQIKNHMYSPKGAKLHRANINSLFEEYIND